MIRFADVTQNRTIFMVILEQAEINNVRLITDSKGRLPLTGRITIKQFVNVLQLKHINFEKFLI